jgi:hypothetical protein
MARVCHTAAAGPFAKAATLLEDLAGVRLTVKRVERAAEASGTAKAAAHRDGLVTPGAQICRRVPDLTVQPPGPCRSCSLGRPACGSRMQTEPCRLSGGEAGPIRAA